MLWESKNYVEFVSSSNRPIRLSQFCQLALNDDHLSYDPARQRNKVKKQGKVICQRLNIAVKSLDADACDGQ